MSIFSLFLCNAQENLSVSDAVKLTLENNLDIKTVEWVEEVLSIALEKPISGLELPQTKISDKSGNKDILTH